MTPETIDSDYNQTNKTLNAINNNKKFGNLKHFSSTSPSSRLLFYVVFSVAINGSIFRWEFYIKVAHSRTLTLIHFLSARFVLELLQASHAAAESEMEERTRSKWNATKTGSTIYFSFVRPL